MPEEVIDKAALQRLLDVIGGDPEDLAELIDEFEATTPKILQDMTAAAATGDIAALRVSAHSLKSNARDFGATALATACETLEHACRDGAVSDPAGQVTAIGENLDEARSALGAAALARE
jgi:HPt (histidine-containing phosphotransfer) domain-containing protein